MDQLIMAMDQGTTSSRCILFDRAGRVCALAQKEFAQHYPRPGWVEHDAREIWAAQMTVAHEAMLKAGVDADGIAAIGITNQRETVIVWDKATGEPIAPAVVWQCRRTAEYCDQLIADGLSSMIREKTGLKIDAYFSGTKLKWLLDHVPGARARAERGELLFGTVDCYLIWQLTRGTAHVTDVSNASRTMMFNIHTLRWDEDILKLLDVPRCMLPEVVPSSQVYGYTDMFGASIPIGGAAGDQQAALFGQMCFERGMAKNTYGTGCFMLMNTGVTPEVSRSGLLTTVAWQIGDQVNYALEGSVFVAGAAIQWLRDEMQLIRSAAETDEIARSVPDTAGVVVVPAFVGLGAPYWSPHARGLITGLTRGAGRAHIVRATLESLAYQTCDVLSAMSADTGVPIAELRVDGGASANAFLMQFQADLIGGQVTRPGCVETTALGAAYLAGLSTGVYASLADIRRNRQDDTTFESSMDAETRARLLAMWKTAVQRAQWSD